MIRISGYMWIIKALECYRLMLTFFEHTKASFEFGFGSNKSFFVFR